MKSSGLMVPATNTSNPPTHSNETPITAPIVSVIGDAVSLNLARREIRL